MNSQVCDVSAMYKEVFSIDTSVKSSPLFEFTGFDPVSTIAKYKHVHADPDARISGHESSHKDMLAIFNQERRSMKHSAIGDYKVVSDYDSLSPLEERNLVSCGDPANFFKLDISGANMGDGTRTYNGYNIGPSNPESCPAGNSRYNYYRNHNKFRANFS